MKFGYATTRIILIVAAIFTPFTSLRFGMLGLGEALFGLSMLLLLVLNKGRLYPSPTLVPVLKFWKFYLIWLTVGMSYNLFFLDFSSGRPFSAAFDYASYLFVFMVVLLLGDKNIYKGTTPKKFFEKIFLFWGLVYSALYVLSLFTPSIFGQPLRYAGFFSPLVQNVHQAAMVTSVMPFVMISLCLQQISLKRGILYFVLAAFFVQMALESGATKAMVGLIVGFCSSVFFFFTHHSRGRHKAIVNVVSYSFVIAIFLHFASKYWDVILPFGSDFFYREDASNMRGYLYANGFIHGMKSFLFGYGPGSHAPVFGTFFDAHNTILTVFLQGGVVAIVLYLLFCFRVFRSTLPSSLLIGAFFSNFIYMLGGDILRRLPTWIIIIGILFLAKQYLIQSSSSIVRSDGITEQPKMKMGSRIQFDCGKI